MSMRDGALGSVAVAMMAGALAIPVHAQSKATSKGPDLGQTIAAEEFAKWDIDVSPSGKGLPVGSGTAAAGAAVYEKNCANCHGPKGTGRPNDPLVGGVGKLEGKGPALKTVGSYWPYATTVFDYVRRSMPWNAPQTLTSDEVYAVTAYLLNQNGIIGEKDVMDAQTLAAVKMPNRDGFVSIYKAKR